MPCRNELKGTAAGIAGKFISRNNDIDGFWAMGVLYKAASEQMTTQFTLDLLSGKSTPKFRWTERVISIFHDDLFQHIHKRGFETYQIVEAIIEVEFHVAPTKKHLLYKRTWGEPFVCRVALTDDLQKTHTYETIGWCGKHDPKKEHRSTRIWPYKTSIIGI